MGLNTPPNTGLERTAPTRSSTTPSSPAPTGGAGILPTPITRLRELLADHQRKCRAHLPGDSRNVRSTGLAALDVLLPHGGLLPGSLVELLSDDAGAGSLSLTLWIARATSIRDSDFLDPHPHHPHRATHRPIIVLDMKGDFYPPAIVSMGLQLDQLVVVQPGNMREGLWAAEQSLRCPAVGAVVASFDRVTDAEARRLQLAAEQGGTVGLVLKPERAPGRTFATVRLELRHLQGLRDPTIRAGSVSDQAQLPTPTLPHLNPSIPHSLNPSSQSLNPSIPQSLPLTSTPSNRRFQITLAYLREGMPGSSCIVELPDEADFVRVPSEPGVGTIDRDLGTPPRIEGKARAIG